MIAKIIAFVAVNPVEYLSLFISFVALAFTFYTYRISRKDKLYIAKLGMKLVPKSAPSHGGKPYFEVKIVNQGQVTIYPESIEIIEKHSKVTSSITCQTIELVYGSGKIPKSIVHDEVILPGKNNYYQVPFHDSLINSNIPLSSMRFHTKVTLENEKVFFLKNFALPKECLIEMQEQRDKLKQ